MICSMFSAMCIKLVVSCAMASGFSRGMPPAMLLRSTCSQPCLEPVQLTEFQAASTAIRSKS